MIRTLTDFVVDTTLAVKDYVVGTVKGTFDHGFGWAMKSFPYAVGIGLIVGLAGNPVGGVMFAVAAPLAATAAGVVWGAITGGPKEVATQWQARCHYRADDRHEQDMAKGREVKSCPGPNPNVSNIEHFSRVEERGYDGLFRG